MNVLVSESPWPQEKFQPAWSPALRACFGAAKKVTFADYSKQTAVAIYDREPLMLWASINFTASTIEDFGPTDTTLAVITSAAFMTNLCDPTPTAMARATNSLRSRRID